MRGKRLKSVLSPYADSDRLEAGCDEAGRGCLAGPVVAAAVILSPHNRSLKELLSEVADSKKLSAKKRELLFDQIRLCADAYAISEVSAQEIDRINIYKASCLAMSQAADNLVLPPDHLLIDGNRFASFTKIPYTCMVRGDDRYLSIAAASILAKVYRDRLMLEADALYPEYGFAHHKGYPTPQHKEAIRRHGLCPLHRRSYAPCQATLF